MNDRVPDLTASEAERARIAEAAGTSPVTSVLFIDAAVADAAQLAAGAVAGVRVVMLDGGSDGVRQIADVLAHYHNLDSVQIISHGCVGQLSLGTAALNGATVEQYHAALATWGGSLADGGDILLYGCDVGYGGAGANFIHYLADATGADVAASTDLTGAAALGGNWTLEQHVGTIEAASDLSVATEQAYDGTLGLATNGTYGFETASTITLLNATGLAAGAVVHADNILGLGIDAYAQSVNGGSITIADIPATSLLGVPLMSAHLTVNGSLLSPAAYLDLRADSGVFDLSSIKLGSANLVGNLLGTIVYSVYALDSNYQPTGPGVSLLGLVVNEYGLLNFDSMANFKGIYGIRITNPLGFEIGVDDMVVANARPVATISSASYNAGNGVLNVTGTGLQVGDTINPGKLTVTGEGGSYTLTTSTATVTSATAFSVTLSAADKIAINGLLDKAGTTAVGGATFGLTADALWDNNFGADVGVNAVTVANVVLPTIASSTYDGASHVLTVSGSNLVGTIGALNDITTSKLTLTGEGGASYTLTSSNVEVSSANAFAITLNATDAAAVGALLAKNGTVSASGTTYTLAAGDDWNGVIGGVNTAVTGVGVTVSNAVNVAPTVAGTHTGAVNDNATIVPFTGVTVADINGDNVSVTITYAAANGTLSGTGLTGSAGSYTLSATSAATLTARLDALVFTPTANQAAPGATVSTTFTLTPTDSNGLAGASSNATVVTTTSINDAPAIGGAAASQAVLAGATLNPFSAMTIVDPDLGASVTVKVALDLASKGSFTAASLAASGFSSSDGGLTYTHAAATPAAAQAAIHALVYQPVAGQSATTTFTVTVNDGSGNISNSATTVIAQTAPTTAVASVHFSADSGVSATDLVTNVAAQTVSGTLGANLAAGERVEVSLDNGAHWATATTTVGSNTWTLAGQTLTGSDTLQVRVANAAGSATALAAAYVLDTTAPTTTGASVQFSSDSGASATDLITNVAAQTITGTLSASLATGERVEVSLDNGAHWSVATGAAGSNAWTLGGQTLSGAGTLQVRVTDTAGNAGVAASSAYVLDTSGPSLAISNNVATLKNGETATITFTFSEAPADFTAADITVANGTVGAVTATADPRVYTVQYTPNPGLLGLFGSVGVGAGTYTDLAGNAGGAATGAAITLNTQGPSVAISSDTASLHTGQTANITFHFSAAPIGFTASDISVSGGTLTGLAVAPLDATTYTAVFTPTAGVASANASITVASGSYSDLIGNSGGAGATPAIAIDTLGPTLAIASNLPAVHGGETATITFTFSEAPANFVAGDISTTGGTLGGLSATANPLVYTATFTPTAGLASGNASITVAGGTYNDAAGNPGGAGASPSIAIDTLAPAIVASSVAFSNDTGVSATDLITKTASQTISGVLSGLLAVGDKVEVSLDNGAHWVNANAVVGTSAWSLAGQTLTGSDTLQVRVSDAAGNHGNAYSVAYVLDTTAPTLAIASDVATLLNGQSATLTFTFSEAPHGFTTSDIVAGGGTVGNLAVTANPLVYTATFTPAAGASGGSGTATVAAGAYTDAAGNNGGAAAVTPITEHTLLPALAISSNLSAVKTGETATITFTFNEAPVGFTDSDVAVAGGTLSGLAVSGSNPLVYTAVFTPTAGVNGGSGTVSVATGAYDDAAGNSGGGASLAPISIDTLAPTLAITSDAAALKSGETAHVTFTFSEAPSGFTFSDIAVTGGILSAFSASANPLVYTALFTPTPALDNGVAGISVAAGAYTDAAGNSGGAGAPPSLSFDTSTPTATNGSVVFSNDNGISATDLVTNAPVQTISGTLSASLVAGEFVEVSLDNGQTWTAATGNVGSNGWSLAGQVLTGSGTLEVRVSDTAGNHGAPFSQAYVLDVTPPSVLIATDASSLHTGDTATITFTFSEAPVGFTTASIDATGGSVSGLAATANPLVWTAVFTPDAGIAGAVSTIALAPGSYTDTAGNGGLGGAAAGMAVDTLAPTTLGTGVSFSNDTGSSNTDLVTNVAAQTISGTLGAPLVSGEQVEVSLDNGAHWTAAVAGTGASSWTLAGQTLSGSGTLLVRVDDAAGNHGLPFSASYALDTTAPTLTIASSLTSLKSADSAVITFTFSEAPDGFAAGDVAVSGGTLAGFTATLNPLVYTAVFTPTAGVANGSASLSVAAGSYADIAGNSGVGASGPAISYQTVAPGVAISSNVAALKGGESATLTFSFSSAPTGFDAGDISVSSGTLSGFGATADPLVYTAQFTPTAGVASANAVVNIAAGSYTDSLGNLGTSAVSPAIHVDTVAPTLAISSNAASLRAGESALVTFTFSEAPSDFSAADISATGGTLSGLAASANPLVWTATFTPTAGVASDLAVISVASGAYTDAVGNGGTAGSAPPIAVHTLAPTTTGAAVAFSFDNGASSTDLVTNVALQNLSGTLNANLAAGEVVEVSLDNGAHWLTAVSAPGGNGWTMLGQILSGSNTLQVRVTDSAGNHGTPFSQAYTIDTVAPTLSMSSSAAALKSGETAVITLHFSEAPVDFTLADIGAIGGTVGALVQSADPLVWSAVFTPTAGISGGSAAVSLLSGAYTDLAGNLGGGASTAAIAVNTQIPSLAITSDVAAVKAGETAAITFTFSEAPVGFTAGDVVATGGTLSGFSATSNPRVYTAHFTPAAGIDGGSGGITVAPGLYTDASDNAGAGASFTSLLVDTVAPTTGGGSVAFSSDNGSSNTDLVTNVALQNLSGTLNATLVAGETVEVSLDHGAHWSSALAVAGTNTWTLAGQVLTGSGTLDVRVSDGAGNHGPVFSQAYVLDTTAPSLSIASNAATLNGSQSANLTFTFSEAPTGFAAGDIAAVGGTISGFAGSGNPLVYTAVLTPTSGFSGLAGVTVAAGSYADAAGNAGLGAASANINLDASVPTLLITSNAASLKSGETALVWFTFSEAPHGFTAGDVSVSGGTLSGFAVTSNPLVYTATFTPATGLNGVLAGITVAAGSYTDAADNPGLAGTSPVISIDTQAPVLVPGAISFSADNGSSSTDLVTNVGAQTLSGTLGGNLPAGEMVEVSLNHGQTWLSTTSAAGSNAWSLAGQVLSGSGTIEVRVSDDAGNHGPVFSEAYTIDTVAPTLTMSSNATALKAGGAATITFTFSEHPVGFDVANVATSNGTLSGFAPTANPLVYTALFTPTSGLTSGSASISLAAGQFTDAAGNAGGGASVPAISIDTSAPTLAITSSAAAVKAGDTVALTFTFSEAPVGFSVADIAVTGGTISGLAASANPLVYTANFMPTAGINSGVASIAVANGLFTDAAGNGGIGAAAASISIDTQAPVATIGSVSFSSDTGASASDLVTSVATQTISGTLTTPLGSGEQVEVSTDNGATWQTAASTVGGTTFSLAGQTLSGGLHTLVVRVSDTAGNHGLAMSKSYAIDTSTPTVAITSNASALNIGQTATVTFTFSEAPHGFTASDLTTTGGTLGNLTATADPLVYTATFTPTAGTNGGTAGISLANGNYTDLAGNSGDGGAVPAISFDTQAPTTVASGLISFSGDSGSSGSDLITNVAAQTISGTLSAPLAAGETVQVSLNNGATWINATAGTGATSWTLGGLTLSASNTLKVRVSDAAGNSSPALSQSYVFDTTAPTVAINSSRTTVTTGQSAVITFVLSDVETLVLTDIAVVGGVLTNLHHGSGNNYLATFTPTADSTTPASIGIADHLFTDAAGNSSLAASLNLTVNTTGPAPSSPSNPGTPSTVDGVALTTSQGTSSHTGLTEQTVSVPIVSDTRIEDGSTAHATLADIPLGIAANAAGIGSSLVVSLPTGAGVQASGPSVLLSGSQAMTDLMGRISDNAGGGSASSDMQQHAQDFLNSMSSTIMLHTKTLTFSGGGLSDDAILVTGAADAGSATALLINAGGLASNAVLQLDNVNFAAIVGAATIHGGAGQNYIVGDDAVQHIVLTSGTDNDTVFGGGGNDIISTAGGNDHIDGGTGNDLIAGGAGNDIISGGDGNDVLEGGRSDVGQWQFYLNSAGQVVGTHQMAMTDATSTETLTAAQLNAGVSDLGFSAGTAQQLQSLSLFYHAAFERVPDLAGLSDWVKSGLSLDQIAQGFFDAPEAQGATLSGLDNQDFVQKLYNNSFGRSAEPNELAFWQGILDKASPADAAAARISVFEGIALSDEHKADWQTSNGVALGGSLVQQEQGWIAGSGNDMLAGGNGNNVLVGGDGTDTAVYTDAGTNHSLSLSLTGDVSVVGQDGQSDVIRQIEQGQFSSGTVDLGFTEAPASTLEQIGMLYHLLLGRAGDLSGFQFWVNSSLHDASLADGFLNSPEFIANFSSLSNDAFVAQIYQNLGESAPAAADLQTWEAYLGNHTRAEMATAMSTDVHLIGTQNGPQGISLVASLG
jgi:hypothetical protein